MRRLRGTLKKLKEQLKRRYERFIDPHLYLMRAELMAFAKSLPAGAKILDAGAGECQYKPLFSHCEYTGCDLAIGDASWDYSHLDIVCDLTDIPRPDGSFDACISIVVLEHVKEPERVCAELWRVVKEGGRCFMAVPFCGQQHQMPYDFYRYTSPGIKHLLGKVGFKNIEVRPWGNDRLTLVTLAACYFKLSGKSLLQQGANKVITIGWTALKALYLNRNRSDDTLPFGWIVEASK